MSGDLQVNTPQALVQCQNVSVTWTGGVEPYYVGYIASGTVGTAATPAVAFRTDEMSRVWQCDVASGVQITLTVRDSNAQMVYSAPITVQESNDQTCLPGYVPPDSSSGLSGGAIGGIVGGVVGGLIIIAAIFALLWRKRRRRREQEGQTYRQGKVSMEEGDQGEPKIEPYVGMGAVDLGSRYEDQEPEPSSTVTEERPTGELERETKAMLGVMPTSNTDTNTNTGSGSTSAHSPIPTKTSGHSHITSTETNQTTLRDPSSPSDTSPLSQDEARPVHRQQEIEYVRHTDGGMVQVELPPLYTDVPRRE